MWPAVLAVAAVSAWQSYEAGQQEAKALGKSRAAKEAAAQKIYEKHLINAKYTRVEGRTFMGQQRVAVASSGIDVGSGLALSSFEDTADKIERQIRISRMEALAQMSQLRASGRLDSTRAENAKSQANFQAAATMGKAFMQTGSSESGG